MGWEWHGLRYTRKNGYGNIDINAEQFQLGKRLYDTQVLYAKIEKGYTPTKEEILEVLHWYCELVNWTGQLRSDYDVMRRCAEGKALFEEK